MPHESSPSAQPDATPHKMIITAFNSDEAVAELASMARYGGFAEWPLMEAR